MRGGSASVDSWAGWAEVRGGADIVRVRAGAAGGCGALGQHKGHRQPRRVATAGRVGAECRRQCGDAPNDRRSVRWVATGLPVEIATKVGGDAYRCEVLVTGAGGMTRRRKGRGDDPKGMDRRDGNGGESRDACGR